MADMEVNLSSIAGMEKTLAEAIETLEENLSNMYGSVSELNKTWDGPNHDAFVEEFENRHLDMRELNKSLRSYLRALKKAQKTYAECEETVFQIVKRQ